MPRWQRLGPAALSNAGILGAVLLAAALRFTRLGQFDNPYYTATVASMLRSGHNLLFASFDPLGVVTVDKPPLAFWVDALSARLLGLSAFSVTLPQAVLGTLAVAMLYLALRPAFGRLAAAAAALALAVLPASVVIDSRNEPDALLSFLLLSSAICLLLAARTGRAAWLLAFAVLMGLGFNTKMLVAFVPLPAFLLYYGLAARHPPLRLARRMAVALALIAMVSLSWVTLVALTPPARRPYVGSTPDNSIWTLAVRYNGLDRFGLRFARRSPPANQPNPGGGAVGPAPQGQPPPNGPQNSQPQFPPPGPAPAAQQGVFDLLGRSLGGQLGWLLPLGLAMLAAALVPLLPTEALLRPARWPGIVREAPRLSQTLLWTGWLATGLLVFGLADATSTHPYYLVGVAVPLAAVTGIGVAELWRLYRRGTGWSWALPAVLLGGAVYQLWSARASAGEWWVALALVLCVAALLVLCVALVRSVPLAPLAAVAFAVGLAGLLVVPAAAGMSAGGRIASGPGAQPRGPAGGGPPPPGPDRMDAVLRVVRSETAGGRGEVILALSAREAAPFIVAGERAVGVGGFSGRDPIFTPERFADFARRQGTVYFVLPQAPSQQGVGPAPGVPAGDSPLVQEVRRSWEDVSRLAGLSPGRLYRSPQE